MIRVGLVGFGMAGRVFHAPLLSSVDGLELAAVMERTHEQSRGALSRHHHPPLARSHAGRRFARTLSLSPRPTEPTLRSPNEILEAGKNVVVDKPMTLTSAEAAELIGLAKKQKALLAPFITAAGTATF